MIYITKVETKDFNLVISLYNDTKDIRNCCVSGVMTGLPIPTKETVCDMVYKLLMETNWWHFENDYTFNESPLFNNIIATLKDLGRTVIIKGEYNIEQRREYFEKHICIKSVEEIKSTYVNFKSKKDENWVIFDTLLKNDDKIIKIIGEQLSTIELAKEGLKLYIDDLIENL